MRTIPNDEGPISAVLRAGFGAHSALDEKKLHDPNEAEITPLSRGNLVGFGYKGQIAP
jgi:hypothetical protein